MVGYKEGTLTIEGLREAALGHWWAKQAPFGLVCPHCGESRYDYITRHEYDQVHCHWCDWTWEVKKEGLPWK
jgi:hypothetical protein